MSKQSAIFGGALVCGSTINTPSEAKKALFIPTRRKLFFAERVAVLRSLTATTDWERSEVLTERRVRL
jgi:hypothetical protein